MNDDHSHNDNDELNVDQRALDDLASILSDPSLWETSDPADEAAIFAAIDELAAAEPATAAPGLPNTPVTVPVDLSHEELPSNVVSISSNRRWAGPFAAGIAAALALVLGISAVTGGSDRNGIELALNGTELAPEADGVVEIVETPNGTVLLLDVSGLPPAAEGSYYEAWVRQDAEVGVSAGTFHLRGGGGDIELWAGVSAEDYPLFTVTIQDEADPVSSGRVVLRGLLGE